MLDANMKYLANKTIYGIFAGLALIFFMVGTLCMSTIAYEGTALGSCPVPMAGMDAKNCTNSQDAGICFDYHLGIIKNFSNVVPRNVETGLLGLILPVMFAFAAFNIVNKGYSYYHRFRSRVRRLLEETMGVFQAQLGFWLTIVQKKDPSYAFALA